MKKDEIGPAEYFDYLKGRVNKVTDPELQELYYGALQLVEKYKMTGQRRVVQKLRFLVDCIDKERELVKVGVDSFVYREDVENYIDNVADSIVKIIELENYPRDIPDDIVETIEKTKGLFDQYYIVFTDYTREVERAVERRRIEKDPILFGTFQRQTNESGTFTRPEVIINDRFYYLGDWVDEYCDLTMDKFLREAGKEKLKKIGIPKNAEELRKELNRLDDNLKMKSKSPKKRDLLKRLYNEIRRRLNRK